MGRIAHERPQSGCGTMLVFYNASFTAVQQFFMQSRKSQPSGHIRGTTSPAPGVWFQGACQYDAESRVQVSLRIEITPREELAMRHASRIVRFLPGVGLVVLFALAAGYPIFSTLAQVAPAPKATEATGGAAAGRSTQLEARHPLDPLEPDEIRAAVDTIRKEKQLAASVRFVTVTLNEPAKALVLHPRPDAVVPREAFMVLLDNATGLGYEAVVNLGNRSVVRFEALPPGVQPSIMLDEFVECEEAARKSPAFQAAMKKRGIDDLSLVMVDAWSAGHYGNEPAEDRGQAAGPLTELGSVRRRWIMATPARSRGSSPSST